MFNIQKFRSSYDENGNFLKWGFSEYSPAYVINNEQVYDILQDMNPINDARILTVAGSGDQPLFYAAAGARVIDTFDISYCAKIISDIKNTALRCNMPYWDYVVELLCYLQTMSDRTSDLLRNLKLSDKVPADTMRLVNAMYGCKIFRASGNGFERCIPSQDVYRDMQARVMDNNFIWSDVQNLHTKLKAQYDQIYLSNILTYNNNYDYVMKLVDNLKPFVAPRGQIMLHTEYATGANCKIATIMKGLKSKVAPWATIKYVKKSCKPTKTDVLLHTYILQKQK